MAKSRLGSHVVFHAADCHHTVTAKKHPGQEPVELKGSTHHPELRSFAGLVTREHDGGGFDIVIFPPGRNPEHVERVEEGEGAGKIRVV